MEMFKDPDMIAVNSAVHLDELEGEEAK